MDYRGPGFLVIRLLVHPLPPSPVGKLSLFLSLPVWGERVGNSKLTRRWWEKARPSINHSILSDLKHARIFTTWSVDFYCTVDHIYFNQENLLVLQKFSCAFAIYKTVTKDPPPWIYMRKQARAHWVQILTLYRKKNKFFYPVLNVCTVPLFAALLWSEMK